MATVGWVLMSSVYRAYATLHHDCTCLQMRIKLYMGWLIMAEKTLKSLSPFLLQYLS